MVSVPVPRHLDARLYSLSLIMIIWLRIKRAMPIHRVRLMASSSVPTDGFIMYDTRIKTSDDGTLSSMLYSSVNIISVCLT